MTEFRMPSLGADMEAGTLVEWLKQPGDRIARGDIVAVVDTDKGAIEIEAFADGVLERTVVTPGQKVPVGTVLAIFRGADTEAQLPPLLAPSAPSPLPSPPPPAGARLRISPAARTAAERLHVDVSTLEGHGPGGAITVADVEAAAAQASTAPSSPHSRAVAGGAAADRAAGMRAAIAAAVTRSKREIPHVYLSASVDLTHTLRWLALENERRSVAERILPAVLFIHAVAQACVEVPALNAAWTDSGVVAAPDVHVGCAIALRTGGLVAPALHHANTKTLPQLAREFSDLVRRARGSGLRSSEMSEATITVTNLGELGAESAYAVIYPPQVAIVAFGRVVERAWVVDGRIEPRSIVSVGLSVDHRAVDGRDAGRFLEALDRLLQHGERS